MFIFQVRPQTRSSSKKEDPPKEAVKQVNDEPLQLEFHRAHLTSLNASGEMVVRKQTSIPATIPAEQRKQDPLPFVSAPLFSQDENGVPYASGVGAERKAKLEPVNFDIFRYDAAGSLESRQFARPRFWARTIATTYHVTGEQEQQLDEARAIIPLIAPGLFPDAAFPALSDEQSVLALKDGFGPFMSKRIESAGSSGLLGQVSAITLDYLRNDFGGADDLSKVKSSLVDAQRASIATTLAQTMNGGKLISYADDSGVPTPAEYKADWEAAQERIRNTNILTSWETGRHPSQMLGIEAAPAIYYDHRLLASAAGRQMLVEQIDQHIKNVDEHLLNANDGEYATLMQENMRLARQTVQEAAAKRGVDAGASIENVKKQLLYIRGLIESNDPKAARAFFDFKVKYAVTRNYELTHPDQGTVEEKSKLYGAGTGSSAWIQPSDIPGFLAFNLGMDFTGRGIVFLPSPKPILDVEHGVDAKNSVPKMGAQASKSYGPSQGYSKVEWTVVVKAGSTAQEYEPEFKRRLVLAAQQANSVWNARANRYELQDGIVVSDKVKGPEKLPNGDRQYTVEIRAPYQTATHEQVQALHQVIRIPSNIANLGDVAPLPVYEMTAWLPLATADTEKRQKEEKSRFRFAAVLGATIVPSWGSTKNLFKGENNVNADEVGDQGHRAESTGGLVDMFGQGLGYGPLQDYVNARKASYFWDVQYNAYRFSGSGLLTQPLFDQFGTKSVQGVDSQGNPTTFNYLADFNLNGLKAAFDKSKDPIIKSLYHPDAVGGAKGYLDEKLPQDPVLKDKPYDFMDSISKIKQWSPFNAALTSAQLWKGFLLEARTRVDPNDLALTTLIDDHIKRASAAVITDTGGLLFPTSGLGGKSTTAWGIASDALVRVGEAAREHGATALFQFNPNHRLMVTFCPPVGGEETAFGQSVFSPNLPLFAKITNATLFVVNEQLNLYKYENDRTLLNMDFVSEVGLLFTSNARSYEYAQATWDAWAPLQGQMDLPASGRNAPALHAAAKSLRATLRKEDGDGLRICDDIIRYSDPYNPQADPLDPGGKCASALSAMKSHLLDPMYLGGAVSDTFLETGLYGNGLNLYRSRDVLGFKGPLPFGNVRMDFRFKEKDTRLFGLTPNGAGLDLDVTGSVYMPSAFYATAASPFVPKGSVGDYVMEGLPNFTKNWIPPVPFRATISRTVPLMTDLAGDFGANLSANATGFSLNQATLFANLYTGSLLPKTNTRLQFEGGFAGTGLGPMGTTLRAQLQTYTTELPFVGEHGRLGTTVYASMQNMDWGRIVNYGVRAQFTFYFGDLSDKATNPLPTADSPYSTLQWEKFGDPEAARKVYLNAANAYNSQNADQPVQPLKPASTETSAVAPSEVEPEAARTTVPRTETPSSTRTSTTTVPDAEPTTTPPSGRADTPASTRAEPSRLGATQTAPTAVPTLVNKTVAVGLVDDELRAIEAFSPSELGKAAALKPGQEVTITSTAGRPYTVSLDRAGRQATIKAAPAKKPVVEEEEDEPVMLDPEQKR